MKNLAHSNYRNVPGGCGFSQNTRGQMVPVDIDDLLVSGSRAQRRFAAKALRKLSRKNSGRAA